MAIGTGTKDDPWQLKTAPGTSDYQIYRDETADPPALVCTVGSTVLRYQLRALDDLQGQHEFRRQALYSRLEAVRIALVLPHRC